VQISQQRNRAGPPNNKETSLAGQKDTVPNDFPELRDKTGIGVVPEMFYSVAALSDATSDFACAGNFSCNRPISVGASTCKSRWGNGALTSPNGGWLAGPTKIRKPNTIVSAANDSLRKREAGGRANRTFLQIVQRRE
jgi:hypothetical protein